MSTTRSTSQTSEATFVLGVLGGTLVLVMGFVFLVLGLSVGVRETGLLTSGGSRAAAMLGGAVLLVGGIAGRLFRDRVADGLPRRLLRHGGSLVAVAGTTAFLLGASAEQTDSAPFLGTMQQKLVLVVVALALIIAGSLIIRLSGRRIGW
jgi:hypothetical protein